MTIEQQKDVKEILSFVQDHRKKQTDDILNLWIQSYQKQTQEQTYAK